MLRYFDFIYKKKQNNTSVDSDGTQTRMLRSNRIESNRIQFKNLNWINVFASLKPALSAPSTRSMRVFQRPKKELPLMAKNVSAVNNNLRILELLAVSSQITASTGSICSMEPRSTRKFRQYKRAESEIPRVL